MAYYQRIRDLREDSDKRQSEIAKYLGTTTQYYGLYEKGANEIPFERAIALAEFYNVSLDYLAGRTNNKLGFFADKSTDGQKYLTEKENAFLEFVSSMSREERKKFCDTMNKIISLIK